MEIRRKIYKVLYPIFKMPEYLSRRNSILIGFLTTFSFAVFVAFATPYAFAVEKGMPMIDILSSWHWHVIVLSLFTGLYFVYIRIIYMGRGEQDRKIDKLVDSHNRLSSDIAQLTSGIAKLTKEIRADRKARKRGEKLD